MNNKTSTKRLRNLLVVMIPLALIIALSLPSTALSQRSPTTHVVYVGGDLPHPGGESMYMGFNPAIVIINQGDTIVWKALDAPHTVTSENLTADGTPLFDSHPKVAFPLPPFLFGPGGFIPPGGSFNLDTSTLNPGTYGFLCTLHQDSGMKGTLTITNQIAPPNSQFTVVTGVSSGSTEVEQFMPNNITVSRGTKIIFSNLSGFEVHTVVSVVTLPNGTRILGTLFDSSPMFAPPGITWDQVPQVNEQGVGLLGGSMAPVPGMDTFSYTFNNPGTYLYYCKYHSAVENGHIAGMVGEVVVLPNYASGSDISDMSMQVNAFPGQIANATWFGIGGIILGLIGVIMAVWALRRSGKTK